MTKMRLSGNIFFIILAFAAAEEEAGTEEQKDFAAEGKVVKITKDIFSESLLEDEIEPHFVMFYAPWCGHCKRLHPTWEALAEKYNKENSSVVIGKVDCTEYVDICAAHNVNGYPTLKFMNGKKHHGIKYKGSRELEYLEKFLLKQLDTSEDEEEQYEDGPPKPINGLIELTDSNFKEVTSKGSTFVKFFAPWCVHCQKLASTWNDLARTFEHDKSFTIGKVDCTKYRSICTEFEVKGYPTLLWIEDGVKVAKYAGDRTHDDLKRFVSSYLGDSSDKAQPEKADEADPSLVVLLTSENFENAIEEGVTLVKFFAPWCGHCKRLAPIYNELGNKFVGVSSATIAKVDCTQDINKKLCSREEIEGFPTLILYKDAKKVKEYDGDRTLDDLVDFVYGQLGHDEL